MEPSSLRITVSSSLDRRLRYEPLRRAVRAAWSQPSGGHIGIRLMSDSEIGDLNAQFRGMDTPTDVLTFPSVPNPAHHLGDIAISVDTAERQARERGLKPSEELQYLAIHGALHLCGLDDETEEQRAEMVREMARVAEKLGLRVVETWHSIH